MRIKKKTNFSIYKSKNKQTNIKKNVEKQTEELAHLFVGFETKQSINIQVKGGKKWFH